MSERLHQRAVVTGASGFIGRNLTAHLVNHGFEVFAVDRVEAPLPCRFVPADLSQPRALDAYLTAETVVFHLAANASVPNSVQDPVADFRDNAVTLLETLESARRTGCAVVFTSSAAVIDAGQPMPLTENALARPSSPYGAAKLAGEAYCTAYHRAYGVNVKIARIFNIYGPGMTRFAVYDFFRKVQQNPQAMEILGDGGQVRDYLYVEDAVRGLRLIHQRGRSGEIYHVASGEAVRMIDLARKVATLMGHPEIRITPNGQTWPGDIRCWYSDTTKIRGIGLTPEVSLDEGLRRTIDWMQTSTGDGSDELGSGGSKFNGRRENR